MNPTTSTAVNPRPIVPPYVVPSRSERGGPGAASTNPTHPLPTPAAILLALAVASVTFAATGCTYLAPKRARVNQRLAEESRALATAVVETLDAQPTPARDPYTQTALHFAKQNQRVQGLPAKPFDVAALLQEILTTEAQRTQSQPNPTTTSATSSSPLSVPSVPLWLKSPSSAPEVAQRFAARRTTITLPR